MGFTILTGSVPARTAHAEIKSSTLFLSPIRPISFLNYPKQSPAEVLQGLHKERCPLVAVVISYSVLSLTHSLIFHSMATGLVWCKNSWLWVWWVDSGWTPGAHKRLSVTVLLSWMGEKM